MERGDVLAFSSASEEKPEWLRERLEWFQDQKFGLILHWGPYALWDCCESWPLSLGDEWARNDDMECWTSRNKDLAWFQRDYWALNQSFNPVSYDPAKWAEAAADAGIRYVAFTTKHHDGFCMWDTATTDYKIGGPGSPYSGDLFKGLCSAFQERGMAISAYFSKADWHCPYYWSPEHPVVDRHANTVGTSLWPKFVEYTHEQIRELMTGYGKIDILWLDAGWVRDDEDIDMPGMVAMARSLQPGLIVANRTVGDAYEDFITPEHEIPAEPLSSPWESCLCMAQNWKYHPRDVFRPVSEILGMLIEIVSKGGNFLLGVGPTPSGEFPPLALERLKEIGEWIKVNGEAIYGTRAIAPYAEGSVRFTQKAGTVYAFLMEGDMAEISAFVPSSAKLLGGGSVSVSQDGGVTKIAVDGGDLPYPRVVSFTV